jgi:ABC-type dipeptide/oligopeptide/nickel transport system ATPase component
VLVYGFIGPSGTGKSHNAGWVANERHIEYIVDDGLLIKGSTIIAGSSAKRESTRIASVKRAIFNDPEQAALITKAISDCQPESILVLGTSDDMLDVICKNLKLPPVHERIYINDVVSEEDIKTAIHSRKENGKHVIPVPTMEIKSQFSGYFLDPLNIFHKKDWHRYKSSGEKSVVRPTFSYMGISRSRTLRSRAWWK